MPAYGKYGDSAEKINPKSTDNWKSIGDLASAIVRSKAQIAQPWADKSLQEKAREDAFEELS